MMYISIAVLILFSAFFSASETAVSTFNRIRMKKRAQDGDKKAQRALSIADRYDKTLSTILIGNNLVNIAASTIATMICTYWFGTYGALVSTLAMTLLILTFGEIIPKSYSMRNADKVAPGFSGLLGLFITVFTPFSFLFTRFSGAFSKREDAEPTPSVTEEELIYLIDSIEEEGVIEEQERDLVQSALEFDEITIREIVTPRVNLVAIDIEDTLEEITATVLTARHSRIPVYENSVDNIIGILYTRDLLRCLVRGESVHLREMLIEPYFVHTGMKLSHLLSNFKSRKIKLAVVLDEYGGTFGIVTMEDMLEELVGEIWDEDDEIPGGLTQLGDNSYEVDGGYEIYDLFEELGYEEEDLDTEHTTVSGWAMQEMDRIPEPGEEFDYDELHCTVLEMDGNRIAKLGLEIRAGSAEEPGGDAEKQDKDKEKDTEK